MIWTMYETKLIDGNQRTVSFLKYSWSTDIVYICFQFSRIHSDFSLLLLNSEENVYFCFCILRPNIGFSFSWNVSVSLLGCVQDFWCCGGISCSPKPSCAGILLALFIKLYFGCSFAVSTSEPYGSLTVTQMYSSYFYCKTCVFLLCYVLPVTVV